MRLPNCSCCFRRLNTRQIIRVIRFKDEGVDAIYYNCKFCDSTMTLISKETRKKWTHGEAA